MDVKVGGFQERRYLEFQSSTESTGEDGKPLLNKYSRMMTRNHDYPGAQVCKSGSGQYLC